MSKCIQPINNNGALADKVLSQKQYLESQKLEAEHDWLGTTNAVPTVISKTASKDGLEDRNKIQYVYDVQEQTDWYTVKYFTASNQGPVWFAKMAVGDDGKDIDGDYYVNTESSLDDLVTHFNQRPNRQTKVLHKEIRNAGKSVRVRKKVHVTADELSKVNGHGGALYGRGAVKTIPVEVVDGWYEDGDKDRKRYVIRNKGTGKETTVHAVNVVGDQYDHIKAVEDMPEVVLKDSGLVLNSGPGSALVDHSPVKVFSQFKVESGMLKGKHITYEFNPQQYSDMTGPKELIPNGEVTEARVTGKYSDKKMTYYTVEVKTSNGWVNTQADGKRPLHITVKLGEGVKPFETGVHAEKHPELIKPITTSKPLKVRSDVFTGDYNKSKDRSRPNYGATKKDTKINTKVFEKQPRRTIETVDGAIEFLEEIDSISEFPETDGEHKQRLISVLKSIAGKNYFPKEVDVYLGKTSKDVGAMMQDGKDAGVYIGLGKQQTSEQSSIEKYVHEMLHAVEVYGWDSLNPKVAGVKHRIQVLHGKFLKQVDKQTLIDAGASKKEAKRIMKYLSGENGVKEFMSYGLTNKYIVEALKGVNVQREKHKSTGLFNMLLEAAKDIIAHIVDYVRKEPSDMTGLQLLEKLSTQLWANNNVAEQELRRSTVSRLIGKNLDMLNNKVSLAIDKYLGADKTADIKPLRPNATKVEKIWYVLTNMLKLWGHPIGRAHIEAVLNQISPWLGHDSLFQDVLRGFSKNDKMQDTLENLGLLSTALDRKRQGIQAAVTTNLLNVWGDDVTTEEQELLTKAMLEVDLQSLRKTSYKTKELYRDPDYLQSKIDGLLAEVKQLNSSSYEYLKAQAEGLGYYMVTHKANKSQLLNAQNIARELNGKVNYEAPVKLEKVIDELATLYAIDKLEQKDKDSMVDLISRNNSAVSVLLDSHRAHVVSSKETLFGKDRINQIKGYVTERFNEDINMKIAPVDKQQELKRHGYVLKYELEDSTYSGVKTAVYINHNARLDEYVKQAVRTTSAHKKGTSILDILSMAEDGKPFQDLKNREKLISNRLTGKMKQEVEMMYAGKKLAMSKETMLPTYKSDGTIKTFRLVASKKFKQEELEREEKAQVLMGSMFATSFDKIETRKHNKKVMDVIIDDAVKNYDLGIESSLVVADNYKDYVLLGNPKHQTSTDPREQKLWSQWLLIPEADRKYLKKAMEKEAGKRGYVEYEFGGVPIRADLRSLYMGERKISIGNLDIVKQVPEISRLIKWIGSLWTDIGQIAKINLLIKTPVIFVQNVMSNMILSIEDGTPINESMKLQSTALSEIEAYLRTEAELVSTKLLRDAATGVRKRKLESKVTRLTEELAGNTAARFVTEGLYSNIIEDARLDATKNRSNLGRYIYKAREKADSKLLKGVVDWTFLTENTWVYKKLLHAYQLGDYTFRYSQFYSKLRKAKVDYKEKTGYDLQGKKLKSVEDAIMVQIRDQALNYNKSLHPKLQWMNDTMLLMFSSFWFGIQKVVKRLWSDKPVNALLGVLVQSAVGDVDDPSDHSMFQSTILNNVHNPVSAIQNAVSHNIFTIWDDVDSALKMSSYIK